MHARALLLAAICAGSAAGVPAARTTAGPTGITTAAGVPTAQTTAGPITGIATAYGGTAFLGVPFAQSLRWGPPRAPAPWTVPLNTSTYNAGCVNFASVRGAETEDCLTANVWLPAAHTPGSPLIVWIHGGGFVFGNADGDFSQLANGTGAVIVSLNYRLGALGFLALEGFAPAYPTPAAPDAACANVGLLDQQAGLLWASANARAFGADPAHVLVAGQSAGGSSVLFALTLPGAFGAYRAAWAVSPGSPTNTLAAGRAIAADIAARLGCPAGAGGPPAQLACLRAAPADAVVSAGLAAAGTRTLPLTLGPVIDGALVTASPAAAMLAGDFNTAASVLVSQTLFEGDSLLNGFTHAVVLTPTEAAAALAQFGVQVGFAPATTAAVGAAYAPLAARDGAFNGSSRIWGDGLIGCAAAWAARGAAAHGARPARRLLYNTTFPGEPAGRATHGSDLQVFFNGAGAPGLASSVWAWAANAAVTGDVNNGPLRAAVPWPAFGAGPAPALLVANERAEFATRAEWQEELCDSLWLPILP
jgi:para-nitrobenzyl esterase